MGDFFKTLLENNISLEFIIKLVLAIVFANISGAILGYERERAKRPAGLKTLVFVTVGSAVFSFASFELARIYGGDPLRIAANIATGIGFLGAGTIVRRGDAVEGLTTASVIWFCGSMGILIGAGYYISSVIISIGGFVFLRGLEFVEVKFLKSRCVTEKISLRLPIESDREVEDFVRNFRSNCRTAHKFVVLKEGQAIVFAAEYCRVHTYIPFLRSADKILNYG